MTSKIYMCTIWCLSVYENHGQTSSESTERSIKKYIKDEQTKIDGNVFSLLMHRSLFFCFLFYF